MFILIILIVILVLFIKNRDLSNEVKNLKNYVNNNKNNDNNKMSFCPNCGHDLRGYTSQTTNFSNTVQSNVVNNSVQSNIVNNSVQVKTIKNKLSKEETKNNLILITGAFFIVLSAFIFLATTWNSTGNFFKTIMIFSMLIIFYAVSKISLVKFNLKQTSRVFLYISLCYIPISLFSISLFRLFGDYLSLFGNGKYIYFSLSCLLVSIIYIFYYKKDKGVFLRILLELFLYATVNFTALIFTNDLIIIGCFITIYTICRELMSLYRKDVTQAENILFSILSGSTFINILSVGGIFSEIPITYSLYILIFLVSLYILFNKIFDLRKIYDYVYPIGVVVLCYTFSSSAVLAFEYAWIELFVITGVVLTAMYDLIASKKIKFPTYVIGTIVSYLLIISSSGLNVSTSFGLYLIISVIFYILDDKKFFAANSLVFNVFLWVFLLRVDYQLPIVVMMVVALFINGLVLLFKKLEYNLNHACRILGNILLFVYNIFSLYNFCYDYTLKGEVNFALLVLVFIGTILLFVSYLMDRNIFKKYLSYGSLLLFLISIFFVLEVDKCFQYAMCISTIIILTLECIIHFFNCKNDYIFVYVLSSLSLLTVFVDPLFVDFLLIIFIDLFLIIYSYMKKESILSYSIIGFSLIPSVYYSDLLTYSGFNFMIFISLLLIVVYSYLSYKNDNFNSFTFISYLYVLLFFSFDVSKYIGLFLLFIVSLIHYLGINDKTTNVYKFIMYTSVLCILENIYSDLGLGDVVVLVIGTILIYSIVCCVTIFEKNAKPLEYISTIIINFIAIGAYRNEIDGVFYVSLLIILVIYGYMKKIGPVFLTSLLFVVLNILLLTREFWFSIPWWIYVLCVGIVLVLFAVKNESGENQIKSKFVEIAHDIDL